MTKQWLTIVGIGEDGLQSLSTSARAAIDNAEIFVGGKRHLELLADNQRPAFTWDNPLKNTVTKIKSLRGRPVCVLATGDPMHYGIGVTLSREFGMAAMRIIPHLSAFTLAAARLGWPLAAVACVTLHGRPLSLLHRNLYPGGRILILSEDGKTPAKVACLLRENGYGASTITVFEHMEGPSEKSYQGKATGWRRKSRDLNTIAIECVAYSAVPLLNHGIGLPDGAFVHDGQLTKQDHRAMTIAALTPQPGQLLWDVGAGCGSVAIEWLRRDPLMHAIAIEQNSKRQEFIQQNSENLGTPNLQIIGGEAPAALKGLKKPDAIFIGGGITEAKLVSTCWQALKSRGRLVANTVTNEGGEALSKLQRKRGGELVRLSLAHMKPLGSFQAWEETRAVVQYRGWKQ